VTEPVPSPADDSVVQRVLEPGDCFVGELGTHETIEAAVADKACGKIFFQAVDYELKNSLSLRAGQSLYGELSASSRTGLVGDGTFLILEVPSNSLTTLSNMFLRNGFAVDGACIYSEGDLRLENVHVILCVGQQGVGISQKGGTLISRGKTYVQANTGRVIYIDSENRLRGIGVYARDGARVIVRSGSVVGPNNGYVSEGYAWGAGISLHHAKLFVDTGGSVSNNSWTRELPRGLQEIKGAGVFASGKESEVTIAGVVAGNVIRLEAQDEGHLTRAYGAGIAVSDVQTSDISGGRS